MRRTEIRKWLLDKGLTQTRIAKEADASAPLVSMVLSGDRKAQWGQKSQAILRVLKQHGCPDDLLVPDTKAA